MLLSHTEVDYSNSQDSGRASLRKRGRTRSSSLRNDAVNLRQICRPIINCIEIKRKRDKINLKLGVEERDQR